MLDEERPTIHRAVIPWVVLPLPSSGFAEAEDVLGLRQGETENALLPGVKRILDLELPRSGAGGSPVSREHTQEGIEPVVSLDEDIGVHRDVKVARREAETAVPSREDVVGPVG